MYRGYSCRILLGKVPERRVWRMRSSSYRLADRFFRTLPRTGLLFRSDGSIFIPGHFANFRYYKYFFSNCLHSKGFDGLFIGRLDYQDKRYRRFTKSLELVWSGSNTLGEFRVSPRKLSHHLTLCVANKVSTGRYSPVSTTTYISHLMGSALTFIAKTSRLLTIRIQHYTTSHLRFV